MENHQIKDDIQKIASEFKVENGIIRSPGKFEGETIATPYFNEASLNGCGNTIQLHKYEKDFFKIDEKYKYVNVNESSDGFVTLEFLTEDEYYTQEFESSESDEDYEEDF